MSPWLYWPPTSTAGVPVVGLRRAAAPARTVTPDENRRASGPECTSDVDEAASPDEAQRQAGAIAQVGQTVVVTVAESNQAPPVTEAASPDGTEPTAADHGMHPVTALTAQSTVQPVRSAPL